MARRSRQEATVADGSPSTPTPKVVTGPIPGDYPEMDEEDRLAIAGELASDIQQGLGRG
jgi:hypothetical protein